MLIIFIAIIIVCFTIIFIITKIRVYFNCVNSWIFRIKINKIILVFSIYLININRLYFIKIFLFNNWIMIWIAIVVKNFLNIFFIICWVIESFWFIKSLKKWLITFMLNKFIIFHNLIFLEAVQFRTLKFNVLYYLIFLIRKLIWWLFFFTILACKLILTIWLVPSFAVGALYALTF